MVPIVLFVLALPEMSSSLMAADKSGYFLWNPTPAAEMREMSTDRPDKTESPFTIDAGHFQLESDLVNWTRDRDGGLHDFIDAGGFNVRAGITNSLEVNVVGATYHYERHRIDGSTQSSEGFGDITLRAKYNFWGNDGGKTAFGVLPAVTLPSSGEDFGVCDAEAGFVLPLSITLSDKWSLGMMTGLEFVNDDAGGHETVCLNSITVGYEITDGLGAYAEFASELPADRSSEWAGYVDFGLTWGVTDNLQFDTGINFGVTDAADDLNLFLGFAFRL